MAEIVYFMESKDGDSIRVGYTSNGATGERLKDHEKYGMKVLALLAGNKDVEERIHQAFKSDLVGQDRSTYRSTPRVRRYVQRLLDNHFAVKDIGRVAQLPRVDWRLIDPNGALESSGQLYLFHTAKMKSAARDCWQTPQIICDTIRDVFHGHIDLDPCSCLEANERVGADNFYTEQMDGLKYHWYGKLLLNPPYGGSTDEKGADVFTRKLVDEFILGHVTEAITILNLQSMPTLWFPRLREYSSAYGIANRRIAFHGPLAKSGRGTAFGSSKNGTVFTYLGHDPERFMRLFSRHAMVFEEKKYKLVAALSESVPLEVVS